MRNDALRMLSHHIRYLHHIDGYISGELSDPHLTNYHECEFGRWYYKAALRNAKLVKSSAYRQLGEKHRLFHRYTDSAVQSYRKGNGESAQEQMREAHRLHREIQDLLLEIDRLLQATFSKI